jgi:serine/threonine protein kinase
MAVASAYIPRGIKLNLNSNSNTEKSPINRKPLGLIINNDSSKEKNTEEEIIKDENISFKFSNGKTFCDYIDSDDYKKGAKISLGRGASANVFKINYSEQIFLVHESSKTHNSFLKECDIIKSLNSPYVMKIFGACYISNKGYLLLEYNEGRTMDKWLRETKTRTNLNERIRVYRDLLKGLEYIHTNGYAHLDIKPANIYIPFDESKPAYYLDFDISEKIDKPLDPLLKSTGTKIYMSASDSNIKTLRQRNYWSLGRVIGEFDNYSYPSKKTGFDFGEVYYTEPKDDEPVGKVVKLLQTYIDDGTPINFIELDKILEDLLFESKDLTELKTGTSPSSPASLGSLRKRKNVINTRKNRRRQIYKQKNRTLRKK